MIGTPTQPGLGTLSSSSALQSTQIGSQTQHYNNTRSASSMTRLHRYNDTNGNDHVFFQGYTGLSAAENDLFNVALPAPRPGAVPQHPSKMQHLNKRQQQLFAAIKAHPSATYPDTLPN